MNAEVTVLYCNGVDFYAVEKSICSIDSENIYDLPEQFFIEKTGLYKYDSGIYLIEKEGLYRFVGTDGKVRQHCYHKEDALILCTSLSLCSNLFEKEGVIEKYDYLNFILKNNNFNVVDLEKVVKAVLSQRAVPWRQGYVVSGKNDGNRVLDTFLEVWNEKTANWWIWLVEDNAFLIKTDYEKIYQEYFNDALNEKTTFKPFLKPIKLTGSEFAEATIDYYYDKFLNLEAKKKLFLENKTFLAMKKNFASTRVFADKKYEGNYVLDSNKVYLDGEDGMNYEISFKERDFLRKHFYFLCYHIFDGKIVKTNV